MVHVVFQDCSLEVGVESAPYHFTGRVSGVLEGSSSDRAPLCKYTLAEVLSNMVAVKVGV